MDELAAHEAFLRAVFAAPDDDTPRLVYADYLDEHGAPARAELIRVQCEPETADGEQQSRRYARVIELSNRLHEDGIPAGTGFSRGFLTTSTIAISPDDLTDPDGLRRRVVTEHPEWYGVTKLAIEPGRALFPDEIPVLFDLPFTQHVTDWNFGGNTEEITAGALTEDAGTFGLIDMDERPVMSQAGVVALAGCRGGRRMRSLDLTKNRLHNDTARALIASPYLINLKRLDLYEGNRFSGRVWQQLIERFGEGVVG